MNLQSGWRAQACRALTFVTVLAGLCFASATPAAAKGLFHHKDSVVYVRDAPVATAPVERVVIVREVVRETAAPSDQRGATAAPQAETKAAEQSAPAPAATVIRERYIIRDVVPTVTTTVRVVQTVEAVPVRKHCCWWKDR